MKNEIGYLKICWRFCVSLIFIPAIILLIVANVVVWIFSNDNKAKGGENEKFI